MSTYFTSHEEFEWHRDKAEEFSKKFENIPAFSDDSLEQYRECIYKNLKEAVYASKLHDSKCNELYYLHNTFDKVIYFMKKVNNIYIRGKFVPEYRELHKEFIEWKKEMDLKDYSSEELKNFSYDLAFYLKEEKGIDKIISLKNSLEQAGITYPEVIKRNTLEPSKRINATLLAYTLNQKLYPYLENFYFELLDKTVIVNTCQLSLDTLETFPVKSNKKIEKLHELLLVMKKEDIPIVDFLYSVLQFHEVQIKQFQRYMEERIDIPMLRNMKNHAIDNMDTLKENIYKNVSLIKDKLYEYILEDSKSYLLPPIQAAYEEITSISSLDQFNPCFKSLDYHLGGISRPLNLNPLDLLTNS